MLTHDSPSSVRPGPSGGGSLSDVSLHPSVSAPVGVVTPPEGIEPKPRIREDLVRSILFRRRLAETLFALELKVLEELRSCRRESFRVSGFVLRDTPAGLAIIDAPQVDPGQMELDLEFVEPCPPGDSEKG